MSNAIPSPKTWDEGPLYWATIRYLRAWYATDGVNVERVKREKLTVPLLRRIAKEYNVNRGIAAADNSKVNIEAHAISATDPSAELLCVLLNKASENWPVGLLARATTCANLVDSAKTQNIGVFVKRRKKSQSQSITQNEIASAITKLLWFLKPHGWTMFDNEAATGLGIPEMGRRERMLQFYQRLHDLGFQALHDDMAAVIERHNFNSILAARIVDKVLMARSTLTASANEIDDEDAFLKLLPSDLATKTKALGLELHQHFGARCLIRTCAEVAI